MLDGDLRAGLDGVLCPISHECCCEEERAWDDPRVACDKGMPALCGVFVCGRVLYIASNLITQRRKRSGAVGEWRTTALSAPE